MNRKIGVYSVLLLFAIPVIASLALAQTTPPITTASWDSLVGTNAFANVMQYIFGQPVSYEGINAISAGIVTIAVWLLLFITFSDIISTFSTFNKYVSWGIGLLIGIIAANIGVITKVTIALTGALAVFGTFAIYIGLGAAFVAFIFANLGLMYIKRAMMHQAMKKEAMQDEEGAGRVANAITSLGKAEKSIRKVGK